jgi:hypothetical protein
VQLKPKSTAARLGDLLKGGNLLKAFVSRVEKKHEVGACRVVARIAGLAR